MRAQIAAAARPSSSTSPWARANGANHPNRLKRRVAEEGRERWRKGEMARRQRRGRRGEDAGGIHLIKHEGHFLHHACRCRRELHDQILAVYSSFADLAVRRPLDSVKGPTT